MELAQRVRSMPPYLFATAGQRLTELRARGVDVIDLGRGSPDLPPPSFVVEALHQSALRPDNHGYTGYNGLPALRRAVVDYYSRRFEVQIDPDREVAILMGSKEGLVYISLAFLDSGSVALVPDPGYPIYAAGAHLAGGVPFPLALRPEQGFLPDLESIPADIAHAARLLWLNYPNNPTGSLASLEFLERAIGFAKCHGLLLCHDNPYCDLTFDGHVAPSVLQVPGAKDVALEFNSLSKTYNMAGWRVGMAVGCAQAVEALSRVKTNVDTGIFRPIQEAAIAALTGDQGWLAGRNVVYQKRRDTVMDFLPVAGLAAQAPKGALYVWAHILGGQTSREYCERALDRAGVWMAPGSLYGQHGEGYVRIALTAPEDRLRAAGERLTGVAESSIDS